MSSAQRGRHARPSDLAPAADRTLTRLLFTHPPARSAAIVARTVGLHHAHAHGRLEGLDFHVAAGELVAVLGGPHAGKSSLIHALAGIDRDGAGVVDVAERRAAVLQNSSLVAWKRVLANVAHGPSSRGGRQAAHDALERVGALEHAHAWPAELGREATVRVLLARAIVRDPALVLLDEPLAGLTPVESRALAPVFRELSRDLGVSMVLATDAAGEALAIADRIVVLSDGRVTLEMDVDTDTSRSSESPEFDRLRVILSSASAGVSTLVV